MSTSVQHIECNRMHYVLEATSEKDRCSACNGNGFTTYATPGDYRAFEFDIDSGDCEAELIETGQRHCQRCEGTGIYAGDPVVMSFKMYADPVIFRLP